MAKAPPPQRDTSQREMLIGKGWVQGVALVMLFGFFVMGILAYRTYTNSMPQPEKVVTQAGQTVFTTEDITAGQVNFQARGLMQYGSIMGHGGYLGPDFTAEYLRHATEFTERPDPRQRRPGPQDAASRSGGPTAMTSRPASSRSPPSRWRPSTTPSLLRDFFGEDSTKYGLKPNLINDPQEIHEITAFFAWTAWASAAERPGFDYSYTNNWPMEPRVDNGPTADLLVWSALSLIALLGGTGLLFAIYGRWSRKIGWHAAEAPAIAFRQPGTSASPRPSARPLGSSSSSRVLFLVQALVGRRGRALPRRHPVFFGFDLAAAPAVQPGPHLARPALPLLDCRSLPRGRDLPRPAHLRSRARRPARARLRPARRPRGRRLRLAHRRGALRSTAWTGPRVRSSSSSGSTSTSPRFWQILLIVGHVPLDRDHLPRTPLAAEDRESKVNMPWLFFFSGLAIPAFYAVGLLATHRDPPDGRRVLALLGRPPVGRGLPRAVHHGDGRLHLRHARAWSASGSPSASSSSTSSCTRWAASSARCTTCTSPARRSSTWPSVRSSPPRRSSR